MKTTPMAHFENKYTVRDDGVIISHTDNKPILPTKNPNGYLKYTFCLNGIREQHLIHQVVAKHFIPNPYNYKQVNHIDGDKTNNAVYNLAWVSAQENIDHAYQTGLKTGFMSFSDKVLLVQRVLKGEKIRDIALEIGRGEESLSGMLRKAAEKANLKELWDNEMKIRRKNVAIKNLQKINS